MTNRKGLPGPSWAMLPVPYIVTVAPYNAFFVICLVQNFEDATRVPFLVHVPGVTDGGMRSSALVELIDIYPTLAELADLPQPQLCPKHSHVSSGTLCIERVQLLFCHMRDIYIRTNW